jgi:hypothetical protein
VFDATVDTCQVAYVLRQRELEATAGEEGALSGIRRVSEFMPTPRGGD